MVGRSGSAVRRVGIEGGVCVPQVRFGVLAHTAFAETIGCPSWPRFELDFAAGVRADEFGPGFLEVWMRAARLSRPIMRTRARDVAKARATSYRSSASQQEVAIGVISELAGADRGKPGYEDQCFIAMELQDLARRQQGPGRAEHDAVFGEDPGVAHIAETRPSGRAVGRRAAC
jgi:hypothetical protein